METGDWGMGDWGVKVLKFDSGYAAEGCGGHLTFIEGALL